MNDTENGLRRDVLSRMTGCDEALAIVLLDAYEQRLKDNWKRAELRSRVENAMHDLMEAL